MVREQKLGHAALRLLDLLALRCDDHTVRASDGAGGLQLRHLLDPDETHATRGLQRKIGVITERRNIKTFFAAHVDQTSAFRHFEVFSVDIYFYKLSSHSYFVHRLRRLICEICG